MSNISSYLAAQGQVSASFIASLSSSDVAGIAQSLTGSASNTFVDQVLGDDPSQADTLSDNTNYTQLDAAHAAKLYNSRGGLVSAPQVSQLSASDVSAIGQLIETSGGTTSTGANANTFTAQVVGLDGSQDVPLQANTLLCGGLLASRN